MATFFVGQRVRHVGDAMPYSNPIANDLVGVTGRLRAKLERAGWWDLEIDGGNFDADAHESVLEPILPDGHRAGDFTNVKDLLDSLTREHA